MDSVFGQSFPRPNVLQLGLDVRQILYILMSIPYPLLQLKIGTKANGLTDCLDLAFLTYLCETNSSTLKSLGICTDGALLFDWTPFWDSNTILSK